MAAVVKKPPRKRKPKMTTPAIPAEVKAEVKTTLATVPEAPAIELPTYVVHQEEMILKYVAKPVKICMIELEPGPKSVRYKFQKYTHGKPHDLYLSWPRTLWTIPINLANMTVFSNSIHIHALEKPYSEEKEKTKLKRFPMPNLSHEGQLCVYTTEFPSKKPLNDTIESSMNALLNSTWNEGRPGDYGALGIKPPSAKGVSDDEEDEEDGYDENDENLVKCMLEWHKRTLEKPNFIESCALKDSSLKTVEGLIKRFKGRCLDGYM